MQKFCEIISINPPLSGKVKDDKIMDRYYSRMRVIYADQSHTCKKDVPRDFSKCMKAYHFLLTHPKFKVEIPSDPTMRTPPSINMVVSEKTLMESNKQIKNIAKQQATMANHQVMMNAPVKIRENYFKELYESITLETINCRMEEEVKKMELEAKKRQLETQAMSDGVEVNIDDMTDDKNNNSEVWQQDQS